MSRGVKRTPIDIKKDELKKIDQQFEKAKERFNEVKAKKKAKEAEIKDLEDEAKMQLASEWAKQLIDSGATNEQMEEMVKRFKSGELFPQE